MRVESVAPDTDVGALLIEAGLPVADLSSASRIDMLGVHDHGRLVGVVGIEAHGQAGLLRSLAVAPGRRAEGLGAELVAAAETRASEQGITTLYLLTTTASGFFARRGYEIALRSEAPGAIAATAQFRQLCPDSAVFMRKLLTAAAGGVA